MAEITNLKRYRKQKARREKSRTAEENRARFGRTSEQKMLETALAEKAVRQLDDHKRQKLQTSSACDAKPGPTRVDR